MITTRVSPGLLLFGATLPVVAVAVLVSPLAAMALCIAVLGLWVLVERPMAFVALSAVVICTNAADVATDLYGFPPIMWLLVPALAGAALVRRTFGREDLTAALLILPLLAIYLFGRSLSLLNVTALGPSTAEFIDIGKDALIALIIAAFLSSMRRVNLVVAAAAASIAFLALLSTFQYLTGTFQNDYLGFANAAVRQINVGGADSWRLTGPMQDANYFGQLLVLGLPLVLLYAFGQRRHLVRILAAVGAAAIAFAIIVTFSRGALVAIVVLGFLGIFSLKRWPIYLIAATGTLILGLTLLPSSYQERLVPVWQAAVEITSHGQWFMDPSLAQRTSVVRVALDMFSSNPLLGVGLGQFPVQYGHYALMNGFDVGAPDEAHNFYLETLAEGGFVGLTLLMILISLTLVLGLRARRSLQVQGATNDAILVQGMIFSFVGFLAASVFLHGAYQRFFWFDLCLLLAVCFAAQHRNSGGKQALTVVEP